MALRGCDVLRALTRLTLDASAREKQARAHANDTSQELFGRGLGWIDVHLLASARLARIGIWTRDRRLRTAARDLDLLVDAG